MNKHIVPTLIVILLVSSGFVGVSNTAEELRDDADEMKQSTREGGGLMNSSWPMYCHDARHTGRSPYIPVDYPIEKWRYDVGDGGYGSPAIDADGTIYFGGSYFHSVYPNGTLKWSTSTHIQIHSCPAIDKDGIIYIGSIHKYPTDFLYAFYPNGTIKWKYGAEDIFSSPVIGEDGTIYFGSQDSDNPPKGSIYALNPNGTLKWKFQTNHFVYSSPAIGDDGTIYCGSHDQHLYALYPNNGTLKWKYKTGHWIRVSPCIADDGTIYIVSLDEYLYALYPNGTLKWKTNVGAGTSPTIGQDGTIYCGYAALYAVNPNGTVKWVFNPGVDRRIRGGTPCNDADGTIYFGTSIEPYYGGEIIAVNPNGTERWRKLVNNDWVEAAPCIADDGTIYVVSSGFYDSDVCYLHAFGRGELEADADGPHYGLINEPVQFNGSASGGYPPYNCQWDFGDGNTSGERYPTHIYANPGNYTVTLTVTDGSTNTSDDTTWAWIQESNDPPDKPSITGETNGKIKTDYDYNFTSTDPEGLHIWYYIVWGDGQNTGWIGPYMSGETITKSHRWWAKGEFTIRCKSKDPYGDESNWGELKVTMPKNQQTAMFPWIHWFLERFSLLTRLLAFPTLSRLFFSD